MANRVDIHSHVFNLHFLPVAGAIRGISKNYPISPNGLPVFLCKLIAKYYLKKMEEGAVDQSITIKDFWDKDQDFEDLVRFSQDNYSTIGLSSQEDDELKEFIALHAGELTLNEVGVDEESLSESKLSGQETVNEFLGSQMISVSDASLPWGRIIWFIVKFIAKWAYKRYLKPYLDWFSFMTKDYEVIAEELFAEYPEIELFIHHDMDMDDWYELDPPTYHYDEQVDRINDLAGKHKGKLIPFYAYNPKKTLDKLRQVVAYGDSNNLSNYRGVKFYPPSGYQPWYDDESNNYQVRNLELYNFCIEHDIPVFTHCNYGGMEAGKDYWRNNDVAHWSKVLAEFPSLRLCFGHAGGDAGWLGDFESKKLKSMGHDTFEKSFPGQIYYLCTHYENVYCEFGYLPDIMHLDERIKFRSQLAKCIEVSTSSSYPFSSKIMYGTDWHMIMQEHGFHDYYDSFVKLFEHKSLRDYTNQFFRQNAMEYLKLNAV